MGEEKDPGLVICDRCGQSRGLTDALIQRVADNARLREALESTAQSGDAIASLARAALSSNVESTQRESSEEAQVNRDTTEVVLALHLLADQVGPLEDEGSLRGAAGVLEAHPVQWRAALADASKGASAHE